MDTSPSLRRGEVSGSVPQIQTYYTSELVSSMVTVPLSISKDPQNHSPLFGVFLKAKVMELPQPSYGNLFSSL